MATSLLDAVDWNDLTKAEYVTAYRILMSATSERVGIASVFVAGSDPNNWGDAFPWASNSGVYGNDGDPYVPLTKAQCKSFLSAACFAYIDEPNIANLLGTDVNKVTRWTEARVFSNFSITEWPDLSILNKDDLKKWYDILTGACKYFSPTGVPTYQWTGIFDGSRTGTGDSLKAEKDYAGDSTAFNSDYGSLYSGPVQEDTNSGLDFEPNLERPYYITASDTTSTLKSLIYQTDMTYDISVERTAAGFNGDPLSAKYYDNYAFNSSDYVQAADELFENNVTFSLSTDILNVTVLEPSIANPISGGLPNPAELYIIRRKNINFSTSPAGFVLQRLILNWDGDGGFDYYTP